MQNGRLWKVVVPAFLTSLLWAGMASAHPLNQMDPLEPSPGTVWPDTGHPASWSFGDVVFAGQYPSEDSLSATEKKMLHGAIDTRSGSSYFWLSDVLSFASLYYADFGVMPQQISAGEFQQVYPGYQGQAADAQLQMLQCPLDGHATRLTGSSFSAGDLYIKALSPAEMQQLAAHLQVYQDAWFNHTVNHKPIKLLGPVLYYRVYGERQVIYDGISYSYQEL